MKRQEALDLARKYLPGIRDWLSMPNRDRRFYCPLDMCCSICRTLFRKKRLFGYTFSCPCKLYGVDYVTKRIFQLAKEQGILNRSPKGGETKLNH